MAMGLESDRAPGPSPKGGCLRAPGMPLFEPSHDQAASDALRQAAEKAQIGDGQQYQFPADVQFWDNFLAQIGLHAGARTPPLFVVSASHDPNEYHVNQQWMNAFVLAWGQQNPHVVTVTGPTGITKFYASEEFWNMLENKLPDEGGKQAAGVEYTCIVMSSIFPQRALRTTPDQWKRVVDNWEVTKKCTAEDRTRQLEERRAEAFGFGTVPVSQILPQVEVVSAASPAELSPGKETQQKPRFGFATAVEQMRQAPAHIKSARQVTRECVETSEKVGDKLDARPGLTHRVMKWGMKKTVNGVGNVVERSCGEEAGETVRDGLGCATDVVETGMNANAVAVEGMKKGIKSLAKGGLKTGMKTAVKEGWKLHKGSSE